MPKNGQDGSEEETQEPEVSDEDSEFIDKFSRIPSERILKQFEAKHRDFLEYPSRVIKEAFDKKWMELTGSPYWQRITTIPQVISPWRGSTDTRRGNPKAVNYREPLRFNKIFWTKIRQKMGKRFKDWFVIDGIVVETGTKRSIFGRLSTERLYEVFGDTIANKIILKTKKENRGEIDVDIEIQVEAYWEVNFAPQKDQSDTYDVRLSVEGICLRFLRMTDVPVPGFYLENADNTTKPIHEHTSGKGLQIVGYVQKYPYTVLRQISYEEFLDAKEKGNAIQREAERRDSERV